MNPKVSIIFVNYKTPKMTADAINSVKEKTKGINYEIIVTDNSNDLEEYNELVKCINDNNVLVIDAKANLGFGKANNLAAKEAKGDYLFFLNTDTSLINDAISILANYLDNNPNTGIVGGNLYTKNMKPNHSFNKNEKNIRAELMENSIISMLFKCISRKRKDFNYTDKSISIKGWICGANLMMRKDIFKQLNGFDKDIFMYAEETLLCYQTIKLGFDIYNIPEAKIIHFDGGTFGNFNINRARLVVNGNSIYYLKAFSKQTMIEYLLKIRKKYKFKYILFKLFKKKIKYDQYFNLYNAVIQRLEEVGIKL